MATTPSQHRRKRRPSHIIRAPPTECRYTSADAATGDVVTGMETLQVTVAAGAGTTSDGKPYSVDSVSLTGTPTGTYNSKDVASASTVTFGGVSLSGTGNGNYTLTASTQAATITPKALTYSGLSVPASRVYDGTADAVVKIATAHDSTPVTSA